MSHCVLCCSSVRAYKPRRTDYEGKFNAFLAFERGDAVPTGLGDFLVQAVKQQNFGPVVSTTCYRYTGSGFETVPSTSGYRRANSFKNFICTSHNLYYELNMYTGTGDSRHHESTRSGAQYQRDEAIDAPGGATKGKHWVHPAQ
ncbi:hypothetical protein KIPB_001523 [Kipferlia bialata]|uniref:Uncharacterized protein n=1 Tax=Kipferlia bialata TaxID=797122 RepID=A0A9K3CNU7_9EUKA|nr:hypothetical protein KIPB_001523 [Kipferlia bialata]|eukprot:g1523.t1